MRDFTHHFGRGVGEVVRASTHPTLATLAGEPAAPSGEDGLIALGLAEAALKSVAEGRTVKMSEIL